MKLGNFILGTLLLIGASSFAQDDAERECKRMRFLAGEELKIKNYKGAVSYYIKGETICGGYDAANYNRLIGSLRNAINNSTGKEEKTAYIDTLVSTYDRSEAAGFYDQKNDLLRASYILQASKPDRVKADKLFRRGIDKQGTSTNEAYVSYFYYNTYALWSESSDADKPALKKKLISEYFELSSLISKAGMSVKTQETITGYFNYVVKNCDDILPELKGYMENLPEDVEVKKAAVMNFITLLEKKECTDAPEYGELINVYVEIDPASLDAQLMKSKYLVAKKKYGEAIRTLNTAKGLTEESDKKEEIKYMIASAQYSSGSYTSAYNTAMSVSGEYKGKALAIAGMSVGKNANNCGASTFDRKCNYIYAVQLLEQARSNGESTGGTIASFRQQFPTDSEIFENGSPSSVALSCYGVSVSPK